MIEQSVPPTIDIQNPLTFGQRLASCREALKLDRKEVASQLRLPEKIIIMLETGDLEPNLPITFLRGYIRSYSKFLAIPEQEVQVALEVMAPKPDADTSPASPAVESRTPLK